MKKWSLYHTFNSNKFQTNKVCQELGIRRKVWLKTLFSCNIFLRIGFLSFWSNMIQITQHFLKFPCPKKRGISIYDDLIQTVCSNLSYWFLFYFTVISNFLCRYNLFPFRKVFEDINFIHCLLYDHNVIIICQLCVNALWNTCKITTIQTPTL